MFPEPSHSTVSSEAAVAIAGAVMSFTVTVAVPDAMLPHASVTVRVTVLSPRSLQSNVEGVTANEMLLQLSVLPLFTASLAMVA